MARFYGRDYTALAQKREARHNREVEKYITKSLDDLAQNVCTTSLAEIAPQLLGMAIQQAGFSDYTGVLINSYMVALFVNGKFAGNNPGLIKPGAWGKPATLAANLTKGSEWKIKGGRWVWSSYGMPGTSRIRPGKFYRRKKSSANLVRYKKAQDQIRANAIKDNPNYRPLIPIRTRRNKLSTEFMTFDYKKYNVRGFGENLTVLRTLKGNIKRGAEIILTNGAPYAALVHWTHKGSRVFPNISKLQGRFISISRKQLERAIRSYNKYSK